MDFDVDGSGVSYPEFWDEMEKSESPDKKKKKSGIPGSPKL